MTQPFNTNKRPYATLETSLELSYAGPKTYSVDILEAHDYKILQGRQRAALAEYYDNAAEKTGDLAKFTTAMKALGTPYAVGYDYESQSYKLYKTLDKKNKAGVVTKVTEEVKLSTYAPGQKEQDEKLLKHLIEKDDKAGIAKYHKQRNDAALREQVLICMTYIKERNEFSSYKLAEHHIERHNEVRKKDNKRIVVHDVLPDENNRIYHVWRAEVQDSKVKPEGKYVSKDVQGERLTAVQPYTSEEALKLANDNRKIANLHTGTYTYKEYLALSDKNKDHYLAALNYEKDAESIAALERYYENHTPNVMNNHAPTNPILPIHETDEKVFEILKTVKDNYESEKEATIKRHDDLIKGSKEKPAVKSEAIKSATPSTRTVKPKGLLVFSDKAKALTAISTPPSNTPKAPMPLAPWKNRGKK